MPIVSAHRLDKGRERKQNEDYIWFNKKWGLFIVADGMGGHEAGEIASKMAATTVGQAMIKYFKGQTEPLKKSQIEKLITEAIEEANETVHQAAKAAEQKRRMGATIVVALIHPAAAYISHAGDARAYLVRGSTLMQLTKDDSWGAQFGEVGLHSGTGSKPRRYDHVLTKAVGQDTLLQPSFTRVSLQAEDWILLCSDGLWNMVKDEEILSNLQQAGNDPEQAAETLVIAANDAGGRDNISIIAIKVLGEDPT